MNVVCYERVCYEWVCYERGLFWVVCYEWSVLNGPVLNGHHPDWILQRMAMESVATVIVGGAFISLTAFKAFLTASNSVLVLLVNTSCAPAPCWIISPLLKMAKPHPAQLVAGSKEPSVATRIESVPLLMSERSWEKAELTAPGGQTLQSRLKLMMTMGSSSCSSGGIHAGERER